MTALKDKDYLLGVGVVVAGMALAGEIIFVLEGTGAQMVEDDAGTPHTEQVRPGTCILIPESRFHSTLNTGAVEMKIFVVYSPAGPEEFLRTLPDFRLIPKQG